MMSTLRHVVYDHPEMIGITAVVLLGVVLLPIRYWMLRRSMFSSLRNNEARLTMALEAAGLGWWDWDVQTQRCIFDDRWANMLGYARSEIEPHYNSWCDRVHPDDFAHVEQTVRHCVDHPADAFQSEFRMQHKSGHWVWIASRGRVVERNSQGQALRLIGLHQDITPSKLDQEHQALMMRELDHRVKNNLATVLSLCRETIRLSPSMEAFQHAFEGRIRAMADTHVALASTHWEGLDMGRAVDMVLAAHLETHPHRITRKGPLFVLSSSAALPISLSLHELMTNAIKHGALSTPSGTINIHWRQEGQQIILDWLEHDGPRPPGSPCEGTGLQLIKGLIQYELSGQVDLMFRPPGLHCRLTLPISSKA